MFIKLSYAFCRYKEEHLTAYQLLKTGTCCQALQIKSCQSAVQEWQQGKDLLLLISLPTYSEKNCRFALKIIFLGLFWNSLCPHRLTGLGGRMGRNTLWSSFSAVTQHSVMKEHCWHSSHFNASPLQQKLLCMRVVWRKKFIYYISVTKTPDVSIIRNQYKTNRNILHY